MARGGVVAREAVLTNPTMSDGPDGRLVLLAAEIRGEGQQIGKCVADMPAAVTALAVPVPRTLEIYGAAALLDSFYSGIEKALERIAKSFGVLPAGAGWHRDLLESSCLDLPGLRPAILDPRCARELEEYLGIRQSFRHLYIFDLEPGRLRPLLIDAPAVWHTTEAALLAFADRVTAWSN